MACEELGNSVDHSRCIDTEVYMSDNALQYRRPWPWQHVLERYHLRLALKVLHDIEKSIIHIRLVDKLNLDLIKVAQSVLCASG